jgi:hypothetical protein
MKTPCAFEVGMSSINRFRLYDLKEKKSMSNDNPTPINLTIEL